LALAALLVAGCHESSGPRKITQSREISVHPGESWVGATNKERFPDMMARSGPHAGAGEDEGEISFDWSMPDGWSQLPTRNMHLLDIKAGPDPDVECSLSVAGGSVLDNVNRWRGQFGQPAIDATAIEKLPRQMLLEHDALRIEIEGAFAGMGAAKSGAPKAGFKLIGLIAGTDDQQVFVKMTGPKAAVEQQSAALDQFAGSLRVKQDAAAAHGGASPHGSSGPGGPPDSGDPADGFDYATPTGWTKQKSDTMRLVNLRPADDPNMDCYLAIAKGGVLMNVNRWRGQFGQPAIDEAELVKLPTLPLFGFPAVRVEVEGDFTTMSGEKREGFALLGLVAEASGQQIFVKMTGPKEAVERERGGFVAFATSLHWKGAGANAGAGSKPAAGPVDDDSGLQYDAPAGWKKMPARQFRLVTFAIGESKLTECVVTQLGGDGGGIAENVNRWRRDQMGLPPASNADLARLPTLKVLGVDAVLVDLTGHLKDSMTKRDIDHARFVGLICPDRDATLFVKLTGPESEVAAAFADFQAFCKSLRR
jgi:hypothetical protein